MEIVETGKPGPLRPQDVTEALADAYARRILAATVRKAKPVKEISQDTGLPLPTTYRHVNTLMEKGLLVIERSALTEDGKRYDLYRSRIRSARLELDGNGERVAWEGNEAIEDRLSSLWDSLRMQAGRP